MKTFAGWILLAGVALAAPAPLPRVRPPVVRPGLYHFTWGNLVYVGRLHPDGRYSGNDNTYSGYWQQNSDGSFWLTESVNGYMPSQYRIDLRSDFSGHVSGESIGSTTYIQFQMRRLGP